ncbi:30S ribosomal protein S24e [Methanothermococcus sp.]|uniref:30S ribosomal protein S24e n=1 Tax=Methanothermococcus sp. TaxID=2614238 RepID=UPI0025E2C3FF|nr:30S ribosomal protein S24e [Methanothermococcus sp.]
MEIEIISDRVNPLLNRREVKFIVKYEGATPSIKDVKMKLIAMLNANKDMVVINSLNQEFGKMESTGYVKVYNDEKMMNLIEKKSVLEKNKIEEEKKEIEAEGE